MEIDSTPPRLYSHSRRPDWGFAILVEERHNRRRYLFQDGEMRTIESSFFELILPADHPLDVALRITHQLETLAGTSPARRAQPHRNVPSFDSQIGQFRSVFPDGFDGSDYREAVRLGTRRRRHHRDPSIADARERLIAAKDRRPAEMLAAAIAVLGGTDLVRPADVAAISGAGADEASLLGQAVVDMLEGPETVNLWYRAMATHAGPWLNWPVATALPALVYPDAHIAVHGPTFRQQARLMAPRLRIPQRPGSGIYGRIQEMGKAVRDRLVEAGMAPHDMLDVHEFIRVTLGPKALRGIADRLANAAIDAA